MGGALLPLVLVASLLGTQRAEAAQPLRIVALGDSVTQLGGFTARYREHVQRDLAITAQVVNLGTNGASSGELLARLRTDATYRDAVATADIITLQVGLNDFYGMRGPYASGECRGADNQDCLRGMVSLFSANWTGILNEIFVLADPAQVAIRPMDIYYSTVAFDQAAGTFPVLNSYVGEMNQHIAAESVRLGLPPPAVHTAFNGLSGDVDPIAAGYILIDGVHTTDAGNRSIADTLRTTGYLPVEPGCPNVNGDNRVNVVDLFLIAKNIDKPVTTETSVFDVNADRRINVVDVFLAAKKIDVFCT